MARYSLADLGQVSYGLETSPYEREIPSDQYFGLIADDVDLTGGINPHTMLKSGGTSRKPYIHSPDVKEYALTIPVIPVDHKVPLECIIGEKVITDIEDGASVKVGEKHTWQESDILQTLTLEHVQKDLDFAEWFIGCKGSLSISGSLGEAIEFSLDMMATEHEYDDTGTHTPPTLNIPRTRPPFRFWMNCDVLYGGKTIATLNSFDIGLDNGITARHHGCGRDAYTVVEETSPDKYDVSLNMDVVDLDLFRSAVENEDVADLIIPIKRGFSADDTWNDGIEIVLKDCKVLEANIPNPGEGVLEADVVFAPLGFELSILTPV